MRFEALFFMVHVQGRLANWTYGVIALWLKLYSGTDLDMVPGPFFAN
jgi:hypothetical protein